MSSKPILIAQREQDSAARIASLLTDAGYSSRCLSDPSALVRASLAANAMLALDTDLFGRSGVDICCELRSCGGHAPVLFVAAPDSAHLKFAAFEAGADDFLQQPFDGQELLLRVRALLRRTETTPLPATCSIGPTVVNLVTGQALRLDHPVSLTNRELDLLRYLYQRRERLVPREERLREVWKYNATDTRTVDMHIATLRRKLETDPRIPRHLVAIRRCGYVLRDTQRYNLRPMML